jgi:hypothetical protein
MFVLGIAGNIAIVTLYVVTRTVGIPWFGPHAGDVEEMGVIDLLTTLTEVALIGVLIVLLSHRGQRQRVRRTEMVP